MTMHVFQSSLIRQKRETAPLFKFENKLDHAKYNKVLRKRKKTQKEKIIQQSLPGKEKTSL